MKLRQAKKIRDRSVGGAWYNCRTIGRMRKRYLRLRKTQRQSQRNAKPTAASQLLGLVNYLGELEEYAMHIQRQTAKFMSYS